MKKLLSLVLALSMVLSMFSFAYAVELTDIDGKYYAGSVEALVELGVINGNPDGTFKGEDVVTRAELAKMLVICLGQDQAAKIAKGSTQFPDVAAEHWASGYINVAAQGQVVIGNPDGTFRPDDEVSYAEAVTMVGRALGYKNVIDATGTWPTNYITKAAELQLLDDMKYDKDDVEAGATRGNVAILLWNMLRTEMWAIKEENQTNGMTYGKTVEEMLDIKFPDYDYAKAEFTSYTIVDAETVNVTLNEDVVIEYAGNDFYTFVEGTEVEVLVNTEDEILLTMVPTEKNVLDEGLPAYVEEEYDEELNSDYAYLLLDGNDIEAKTELNLDSVYVEEVVLKETYVRINETRVDEDEYEEVLVLVDGERKSLRDVEEGTVLTKVEVADAENTMFLMADSEAITGTLKKYVVADAEITVDSTKYPLDEKATYIIDPEDEDSESADFASEADDLYEDFKNEEVRIVVDAFGRVVRIEFGDLSEDEDTTYGFFKTASAIWAVSSEDGIEYRVKLENEDGSNTYVFDEEAVVEETNATYKDLFVFAEFNEDGEVLSLTPVAEKAYEEEALTGYTVTAEAKFGTYEEDDAEKDKYEVTEVLAADYENGYLKAEGVKVAVEDDVVVVKLLTYEEKDELKAKIEFAEGLEALASLNGGENDNAYAIVDLEDAFAPAKYVLVFDDAVSSDVTFGIVVEAVENRLAQWEVTIELEDGEEIETISETAIEETIKFIAFVTEENEDEELELTILEELEEEELNTAWADHGYVEDVNSTGRKFYVADDENQHDLADEDDMEALGIDDETRVVIVEVAEDADDETQYEVESFKEVALGSLKLKEADRISKGANENVVFVIRGMEKVEDLSSGN